MSINLQIIFVVPFVLVSISAEAGERYSTHRQISASYITDGPVTIAPLAFLKFCMRYASQCSEQQSAENSIKLTPAIGARLAAVNAEINHKIRPDPNKGAIDWSLETRSGNCNDYAVQKRSALAASGFPLAALSLMTALTSSGEGHLVLNVRTDKGDLILDNLHENIVPVSAVNYTWLKRQTVDPMKWVSIEMAST